MKRIINSDRFDDEPTVILFDTDNTLYPYAPSHHAAVKAVRVKVERDFSVDARSFDQLFLKARADVKARLGATAPAHSRLLYFQRLLEMLGLGSQVLLALDLEQTYWRTFLSNASLFPGVTEVLSKIQTLGIPIAIVTDLTAQIQFRKIVYFGLDHYFDYIVTSEEAGADKPAAAQFKLALEKMSWEGGPIWMIGDDSTSDIQGAREHINAVTLQRVDRLARPVIPEVRPDAYFDDFKDLLSLLKVESE